MRDRVDASAGLVLRSWQAEDAPAVLAAFADPLMRSQSSEAVDSGAFAAPPSPGRQCAYGGSVHDSRGRIRRR
ncbi:hypothetical protein [Streptomyces sp. ITFR-6]|uniref:hypothetical protein n=1 Tax=Streptomyces sp. ITFR-6 TaxID=3075197 RepID=UPI00288AB33E|nr:hypothetical protein [Streptomyces sp. ITFR-6]WNI30249.1 hypothetical protein RLT59_16705 [Streptomyces sp. ITFR-6]